MENWRPWNNYREALLHFYNERRCRNSSYSLRAYARDLEFSPSRLNGIMKGKFGLSFEAAAIIANQLDLSYGDKWLFQYMVESEHGRSEAARLTARDIVNRTIGSPSIKLIEPEKYKSILSWQAFAILEMVQNPRFKNDPSWIAERLGIDIDEVGELLNELIKIKAITKNGDDLERVEDFTYVEGSNSFEPIRNFHSELLKKTDQAIADYQSDKLEFNAWVLSIDMKQVPMAQIAIENFLKEFCRKFGRLGLPPGEDSFKERDAVYCLSAYLFPLAILDDSLNPKSKKAKNP